MRSPRESHRARVQGAIHLLDCAALYGEVFGLDRIARDYAEAAMKLLAPFDMPVPLVPTEAAS